MKIEEALDIIDSTNFYTTFANEKQDEAFNMAYRALKRFGKYKEEVRDLQLIKDHTSTALCCIFSNEIAIVEGSGDNGK
jgi:hypothetical protein